MSRTPPGLPGLEDYADIRQRAIRSLFEIIEQTSNGTVIVDREARIVWINQRYAQHFGLPDAAARAGERAHQVVDPDARLDRERQPALLTVAVGGLRGPGGEGEAAGPRRPLPAGEAVARERRREQLGGVGVGEVLESGHGPTVGTAVSCRQY